MSEAVRRLRILLIDDEPFILNLTKDFLEAFNYEVLTASNGSQGLEIADRMLPDAIICDLTMPDMDGLAVLDRISKNHPLMPFVVFSGTGNINDAISALKKGAWDYLLKPLTNLSLINHTLERVFERRNLLLQKQEYQERLEREVLLRTQELTEQIQQQKVTEELLRQSLSEQEVLISEVHHRVKNNLQIIISLLDLQASGVDDDQVRQFLHESQNRIQAMALIHERLYDSSSVSQVDCKQYFKDIAEQLIGSLGLYKNVRLSLEFPEFFLPSTQAFPAGLLFNEIIFGILENRPPQITHFEILVSEDTESLRGMVISDDCGSLKAWAPDANSDVLNVILLNILVAQAKGAWVFDDQKSRLKLSFS